MAHRSFLNNRALLGKPRCSCPAFEFVLNPGVLRESSPMSRHIFSRFRYSPFLAQMVVIRRCNLSCGYCSEFDKTSDPVPVEILEKRLEKLKDTWHFRHLAHRRRADPASGSSAADSKMPRAAVLPHRHDLERIFPASRN